MVAIQRKLGAISSLRDHKNNRWSLALLLNLNTGPWQTPQRRFFGWGHFWSSSASLLPHQWRCTAITRQPLSSPTTIPSSWGQNILRSTTISFSSMLWLVPSIHLMSLPTPTRRYIYKGTGWDGLWDYWRQAGLDWSPRSSLSGSVRVYPLSYWA